MFDPDIQCGMTQEQAEWIGRMKDQTDPRTRQDYPPDGATVTVLRFGDSRWYTGMVWQNEGLHWVASTEGKTERFTLEDAAHWYEPAGKHGKNISVGAH